MLPSRICKFLFKRASFSLFSQQYIGGTTITLMNIYRFKYLATICKHRVKDIVTTQNLKDIYAYLEIVFPTAIIINEGIEAHGLYKQLHAHIIIKSKKPLHWASHTSFNGFRIFYRMLTTKADLHRAQIYCAKHQYDTLLFG